MSWLPACSAAQYISLSIDVGLWTLMPPGRLCCSVQPCFPFTCFSSFGFVRFCVILVLYTSQPFSFKVVRVFKGLVTLFIHNPSIVGYSELLEKLCRHFNLIAKSTTIFDPIISSLPGWYCSLLQFLFILTLLIIFFYLQSGVQQ